MFVIGEKTFKNILIGPGKLPEFSRKGPQAKPQPDLKALRRPPLDGLRCVEKIKNVEKFPLGLPFGVVVRGTTVVFLTFFIRTNMITSFSNLHETRFHTDCVLSCPICNITQVSVWFSLATPSKEFMQTF